MNTIKTKLRSIAALCGTLVVVAGVVVLFSWMVGWRQVASLSDDYIPMAPNTALSFLLIGSCLLAVVLAPGRRWFLWLARIGSITVSCFALIPITEYVFDYDSGINHLLFASHGIFQGVPEGHMSPLTAMLLIASAFSLLLLSPEINKPGYMSNVAASLACGVLLGGLVLCTGYLYGTPLLYGETIIPVALSSALAIVFLAIGLVAAAGAGSWPVDVAAGIDTRSRLLRVFLPIVVLSLIFNGWIDIRYVDPGSSNQALTESVLALLTAIFTGFVVFRFSRSIGGAIDEADKRRQLVERELRAERDFASNLVETSPSGIISADADGKIVFANRRAESILGLIKNTMEQRSYNEPAWKITDLEGRPLPDAELPFRQVMDGGLPVYGVRHAIEWPDGRRVLLSINAAPVFHGSRKPVGMVAAIEDITGQVEASQNILREKVFGETIINSLPGIFYMFSEAGGMYRFNRNLIQITGYSEDELPGMQPLDFIAPEDCERVGKAVMEAMSAGFSSAEARLLTKDGATIPFFLTAYRLELAEGIFLMGTGIDISQRVAAEEELKRESLKAQRYLDVAGVILVAIDANETVRLINDKGCDILGYQQEQILGQNWFDNFIPEPERETLREGFRQLMTGDVGAMENYENQIVNARGENLTIAWHNTVVRDEAGKINYSFSSGEDVTQRNAALQAMAESEARYRGLFENLSDAAFLADVETGIIVETNRQGEILLGRDRSEILGMRQSELHPAAEAEKYRQMFAEDAASGASQPLEAEVAKKDGTRAPVSISSSVMKIGDKEMILGLFTDISGRLAAEKSIRESEERYHSLFEESRDTIFISAPDGRFIDINPAGVQLFGYGTKEDLLKVDIANEIYLDEDERVRYQELLARQGFVQDYYAELKTRSGKKITTAITATAVHDSEGRITAYRGSIRDMTEQRVLQEQLIQAQKMESIGRLAGGVAHDFNNFLTAIQGYTDLALAELSTDHPAHDDLVEARAASGRAAELTRQLLLFSRRESMNLKPINLNAEIEGLLKLLNRIIGENYAIIADLEPELWTVRADPAHMEQIIMNLAVNARDAMVDGGQIVIRTRNMVIDQERADQAPGARPGNFVCVTVIDSGTGMDDETLRHVFEPFFSTKKGKHGTGLGLSVVYGIIAEHGGWIEVESEPDVGSSFHVFLPVELKNSGSPAGTAATLRTGLAGQGEKVLLVEDDAAVRSLAQTMLSRNGYRVTAAPDADAAARLFAEANGDFQLLFSDVVLPGESGLTLARRLAGEHPDLHVVLASGYNEEIDQQTIGSMGFRFLQKPYAIADLLALVREVLAHGKV